MGNYQPWVYPAHWSVDEHNAVLAALRKAEAELERMGKANGDACDRIRELETQLDIVTADRDHYRDEYQPVSAARDKAEARVRELEAALPQPVRFSVTAEEAQFVWNSNGGSMNAVMAMLAQNTIIAVPKDVPTAKDIAAAYNQYCDDYSAGKNNGSQNPTSFCYEYLLPYLRAAALPQPEDIAGLYRVPELLARIAELEAQLAAVQPAPAPADADTLEALAEIAKKAYKWRVNQGDDWEAVVAAILRAARPRLDATLGDVYCAIHTECNDFMGWLNSRIRFCVELPPTEPANTCLSCGAPRYTGKACEYCNPPKPRESLQNMQQLPSEPTSNSCETPVAPTDAHIGAEIAAVTAERDQLVYEATRLVRERDELRAELAAVTAERDAVITKHREYIDLEVNEKKDHYARLRAVLGCNESEHWMSTATRLLAERDDLRRQLAERTPRPGRRGARHVPRLNPEGGRG